MLNETNDFQLEGYVTVLDSNLRLIRVACLNGKTVVTCHDIFLQANQKVHGFNVVSIQIFSGSLTSYIL